MDNQQLPLPTMERPRILKPREQLFMKAFLRTGSKKAAYLEISPGVKPETAEANGCRMMKRILSKVDDPEYFDEFDMGKPRVWSKLNELLEAENHLFYKVKDDDGEYVLEKVTPDRGVQMRAVTLLADINGMKIGERETNDNTTVVINNPLWVQIRGVILKALEPYPDARSALLEALRNVEG